MELNEPIHVVVQGRPDDPRTPVDAPKGVIVHYSPTLHPDDMDVVDGIPITSVSRTLIDLAEVCEIGELRECFANASARGLLDRQQLAAARARVEWRPSLEMLDQVIAEFT